MKKTFKVTGMHCKSCEMLVKDAIESTPGLKVVRADAKQGLVEVDATDEKLLSKAKSAIEGEGYKVAG